MKKENFDLYKAAYEMALDQAPDIQQLIDCSESLAKHLGRYSETLLKAKRPLQVLMTADRSKDMMGYQRIDIDENLSVFEQLEETVVTLTNGVRTFKGYLDSHNDGLKLNKNVEEFA